jgi:hypothetical protein
MWRRGKGDLAAALTKVHRVGAKPCHQHRLLYTSCDVFALCAFSYVQVRVKAYRTVFTFKHPLLEREIVLRVHKKQNQIAIHFLSQYLSTTADISIKLHTCSVLLRPLPLKSCRDHTSTARGKSRSSGVVLS